MRGWRLTLVLGAGGSCCWDDEVATSAAVYRFDPVPGVGPGGGAAAAQGLPRHAGGQRGGHAALLY